MPAASTPPPHVLATLNRFAHALKRARVAQGLSQADLAGLTGLRDSYVSMLERGQRVPPLDTLAVLAHALHLQPRDLV